MTIATFDPAHINANLALSNGNLTATQAGAGAGGVRSTTSQSSGKWYVEFTTSPGTIDCSYGFGNASYVLSSTALVGGDLFSVGAYPFVTSPSQIVEINNAIINQGATPGVADTFNNGSVISLAFDVTGKTLWWTTPHMRSVGFPWNNSTTANPSTNTGGISCSTMGAGPYFVLYASDSASACVANFGASAWSIALPTGFQPWNGADTVATLSASTKKPATSISGKLNETATLAAITKKPVANITALEKYIATISATTKKPIANIAVLAPVIGSFAAGTKKPVANLVVLEKYIGTISAHSKKPTTRIAGFIPTIVIFAAITKKVVTTLLGSLDEFGPLTTTTKKPSAHIVGLANLAAPTKKPTANINLLLNESGGITAVTRKPVTRIALINGVLPGDFIILQTTTKKPSSSINATWLIFEARPRPLPVAPLGMPQVIQPATYRFLHQPEMVTTWLACPWAIGFLPDGNLLVTQRDRGYLTHVNVTNGDRLDVFVPGTVSTNGDGGLLGLAIDPQFSINNYIYLVHTVYYGGHTTSNGNQITRYVYHNTTLTDPTVLASYDSGQYFNGGSIKFAADGTLFVSTGSLGVNQNLQSNNGKVLHVSKDGSFPTEIWASGFRNPLGLTWQASSLWVADQGGSNNDRIYSVNKGQDYSTRSPALSSGDFETWGPAGLCFHYNALYWGALGGGGGSIYGSPGVDKALTLGALLSQRRINWNLYGRIRECVISPDNLLYFSTSNWDGVGNGTADSIFRVSPP